MDFREELNQIKKDVTVEEFVSATILNAKIILNSLQKEKISKIIFVRKDSYTITSSVEIGSNEQILLFEMYIPISSSLGLREIKELLDEHEFYSVYNEDDKKLYWQPNRW